MEILTILATLIAITLMRINKMPSERFKKAREEFERNKKLFLETGVKSEQLERLQKMVGYSDSEFIESLKGV